jgi:hypothetical protein
LRRPCTRPWSWSRRAQASRAAPLAAALQLILSLINLEHGRVGQERRDARIPLRRRGTVGPPLRPPSPGRPRPPPPDRSMPALSVRPAGRGRARSERPACRAAPSPAVRQTPANRPVTACVRPPGARSGRTRAHIRSRRISPPLSKADSRRRLTLFVPVVRALRDRSLTEAAPRKR